MKVIYAGFSKCGTKSMAKALRELGYNVHDFMDHYEQNGDKWEKICKEGGTKEDFQKMLEKVDAVTDIPAYFFWQEILEAFPEAKIIFCQRETEDEWWNSFYRQLKSADSFIITFFKKFSPTAYRFRKFMEICSGTIFGTFAKYSLFTRMKYNSQRLRIAYRQHNNFVLQNAPKDKLLIWKLGDGWKPICEFLELPIPNKPFPHSNKNASLWDDLSSENSTIKRARAEGLVCFSALTVGLAYGVCKIHCNFGWNWVLKSVNYCWNTLNL